MLAERLKELRINKGITQKAMADYLGIIPNSYRKYEYGEREPSFDILIKLADYFDVSIDYLLRKTDNPHAITIRDLQFMIYNGDDAQTNEERAKIISRIKTWKELE